ncbi:KOW motif-containing protein [Niabella sp. W65]|nr:KOW motif-containing protein [Niabella sp. W65]MCH7363096.1 KOW motif-containing protein [Niabella sp. W65]ULT39024.1 KOW motif-containing protein [Niabella sp. I65]
MDYNNISLKDGDYCKVLSGTHKGKQGRVRDIHTSKTGHITITVEQDDHTRFKTLARNVEIIKL